MAKFLLILLCFVLAELSFIGNAHGARRLVETLSPIAIMGAGTNAIRLLHAAAPSSSPAPSQGGMEMGANQDPGITHIRRHHSVDKSVAGGDVILGGFATALIAAIFCYLRVTWKSKENHGDGESH